MIYTIEKLKTFNKRLGEIQADIQEAFLDAPVKRVAEDQMGIVAQRLLHASVLLSIDASRFKLDHLKEIVRE